MKTSLQSLIKNYFVVTIILFQLNAFSQITFEKGYFITNENDRTVCLIKNLDWMNNPDQIEYKLTENSDPIIATINTIKEFGIEPNIKYIKAFVEIDKSSENISKISTQKEPIFKLEELFLRVLIEGEANLYSYSESQINRFFYTIKNNKLEQLIYKRYVNEKDFLLQNNTFRQQIWTNLKCKTISKNKIENLGYDDKNLVKVFLEYNNCTNSLIKNNTIKPKKDLFNLSTRVHLNQSSLEIINPNGEISNIDFGSKNGIGFGIEAEVILPYNKNKWSIILEPTFQSFIAENIANDQNVQGGKLISSINYQSIEIPIGVRHSFFINKNSKIFINASYIFDFNKKSLFEVMRIDNSIFNSFELKSRNNFGFGLGYKFLDKISIEMRLQTRRNILASTVFWTTDYTKSSLILGYSFF